MARNRNQIIDDITDAYMDKLNKLPTLPTPAEAAAELTTEMEDIFTLENLSRGRGHALRVPETILPDQIVLLMLRMFTIRRITCGGPGASRAYDLLCIYVANGPDAGLYVEDDDEFYRIIHLFNRRLQADACDKIIKLLREKAPRVPRCSDPDLVAVKNGIFDYKAKKLMPFSPEYVFMAKCRVDYNPNAHNPIIRNPDDGTVWDVDTWMEELSDHPEIVDLLWEILGAIVRPNVPWNKSAWLFSERGNNGKGTLCELMRGLCGENSVAALSIKELGGQFALETLMRATAIIADENDVGTFVDKAANLKAIITGDTIYIDRKHRIPVSYRFRGFMVQCLNEFPRIKDKSDSFYRRQLFIPFDKCFTGKERKYIKEDYLHRKDVLEYVLYRVLNMNYYELSNPQRCQNVLEEYKGYNDPVRQFFQEMEFRFAWNLLPLKFVYDLYKAWFFDNNPRGSVQGKNTFLRELYNVTQSSQLWTYVKTDKAIRPGNRMDAPEPLIIQYKLENWMNPHYTGSNPDLIAKTAVQDIYHGGLLRRDNPLKPLADPNCTERTGT